MLKSKSDYNTDVVDLVGCKISHLPKVKRNWLSLASSQRFNGVSPDTQIMLINRYFKTHLSDGVARLALIDTRDCNTWVSDFVKLVIPRIIKEGLL